MTLDFNPPNLDSATEIVYDVETDGINWLTNKVVGYVLTWGKAQEYSVYYPVDHEQGENYDREQVESYIRYLAQQPNRTWIGHNMKFDLHFSLNHDIVFHPSSKIVCTQVNAALLNESQFSYSLDACAKLYGVTEKKGDLLYEHIANQFGGKPGRNQMANFYRLSANDPLAHEYATGDGTSTWEVWQYQKPKLLNEDYDPLRPGFNKSLRNVFELECEVLPVLVDMERQGVLIDLDRYDQVRSDVCKKIEQLRSHMPFSDISARSPSSVKKTMMEDSTIDWKKWPTTPTGKPRFTESDLELSPLGKKILEIRKLENLQATFLDGQIAKHLHNGRVHTTFNQLKSDDKGTITGRLSSSSPNLQQVPKRNKEIAALFRRLFIPDAGMVWSSNDYMQQEFVVFAHFAQVKQLIEGYAKNPPVDCHTITADLMGVERDPTAKRIGLGKLYWMGIDKLAVQLECSKSEAKRLADKWDDSFPEAKKFRYEAKARAEKRGYVCSILGRRRRFMGEGATGYSYQAANAIIQMSSADITKLKMVELHKYFKTQGCNSQLLLQVHDELNWQCPKELMGTENKEALRIMSSFSPDDRITLNALLHVEHEAGDNWGEATFGKGYYD